ncbi:MAG: helix-turn-helix transcriptional regulator [Clostridia bacterium]|nr:helix-turn-helix transcriptional regulator [Clostridia bacterium]
MLNRNFVLLTDLVNYINIRVSHIFHRELGTEWCFDNYCNNFNRIYIVTKGSGILFNDTEHIVMQPDNIYVIPANHTYSCRCDDYMEKFFIHFTSTIIPQKDLLSDVNKIITIPLGEGETEKINEILYAENVKSALLLRNYICRLILQILGESPDSAQSDIAIYRKYERLYKYIEDNLCADLTVNEVCRHIGFSQTYIGQKFKADTGSTIKQYITNAILEQLKLMLISTKRPIGDIAAELKFDSESYCSKFFKKHMGITPNEYRKRHKLPA